MKSFHCIIFFEKIISFNEVNLKIVMEEQKHLLRFFGAQIYFAHQFASISL
jgi:hypothetical protein